MIYVLCGPIGCGKSTWARNKAQEGAIVVNQDSLVTMLHGGNYKLWDYELKLLYKSIEHDIITHAVSLGKDVVIDNTNPHKKTRQFYREFAKRLRTKAHLVHFEWPPYQVSAYARFNSDNRGYTLEEWIEVAERHFSNYEPPNKEEWGEDYTYVERYYDEKTWVKATEISQENIDYAKKLAEEKLARECDG